MVWLLAIVFSGILLFFIYVSIEDGLTPLLAVPLALSAIIPLNVKNMNALRRNWIPDCKTPQSKPMRHSKETNY